MSNPKFAETHNLVAFLEKPKESDGFKGIIDFLNASSIRYALMPDTNLVDKKKVIITETSIRSDLKLEDAEGTYCLPNATIFSELERIGAKTTAWNEFSSTMASAIICLATNQNFNFFKYIFDNMVKNLEGGVKFLMYPRFVQVFLDNQVEGMTKHKGIYVTPSHTKKVFANMKRPRKGFFCRFTPLFQTMMVQAQKIWVKIQLLLLIPIPHPLLLNHHHLSLKRNSPEENRGRDSGPTKPILDEATNEEHVSTPSNDPPQSEKVLDLEKAKTAQAKEIASLKKRVKQLEKKRKLRTPGLKRLRKVVTTSSAPTTTIDELTLAQTLIEIKAAKPKVVTTTATTTTTTTTRPKARGVAKDKGKAIMVEPEIPLKRKDQIALDEKVARNLKAQLQAELEEEERLARQKEEEATIALIESWDNTQAIIEADRLLAKRLQTREQDELTDEEKARLFVDLLEKRKKHFAALRAK
ncbi:hypothetical protein Tco_1205401 [Tanacetum coccineum]